MRWIAICLVVWCVAMPTTWGCLAHYRSPEELVTESPLIVAGTVTDVAVLKAKSEPATAPGDRQPQAGVDDEGLPAVVTVKVERVIKGAVREGGGTIKVRSGPVSTCAPYAIYHTFQKGQTCLLILSSIGADGVGDLRWGGSAASIADVEMIEGALRKARDYQQAYLEQMKTDHPKAWEVGQKLAAELAEASKRWPSGDTVVSDDDADVPEKSREAYAKASDDLARRLDEVDLDAMHVALAIAWSGAEPSWSRAAVWEMAARAYSDKRGDALDAYHREHIRRRLLALRVAEPLIDTYLKTIKPHDAGGLEFPLPLPDPYRVRREGEELTTDFLLRCDAFNRGAMFRCYGMWFDSLKTMNPQRLKQVIPVLLASPDRQLRNVAGRAIEYMPGDVFMDLVLDEQLEDKPWAWRTLCDGQRDDQRLRGLITLANARGDGTARWLWGSLRTGECFKDSMVNAAVEELQRASEPGPEKASERASLREELRAYLDAAKSSREGPGKAMGVEDYRAWFKAHPEPKRE